METTLGSNGEARDPSIDDDDQRVKTIWIEPPIEQNSKIYEKLELQEPKHKQVRRASGVLGATPTIQQFHDYKTTLISLVADVPRSVIEEMGQRQVEEAFDFLRRFESVGPTIGKS